MRGFVVLQATLTTDGLINSCQRLNVCVGWNTEVASNFCAGEDNQNSERSGKVKELLQSNSSLNWQYI